MVTSRVVTKYLWEYDVLEELGKIKIELRQVQSQHKWDPGGTVSLLAGPRGKAPGRIPGKGQSPGSFGHFKVFKDTHK